MRFPDPRNEDHLLLPVQPFPEERLSRNQDPVLTDFLRIKPRQKNRPKTLKESFESIRQSNQEHRLNIPRQKEVDENEILLTTKSPRIKASSIKSDTQSIFVPPERPQSGRPVITNNNVHTSKPIRNPLLQKLFNRESIPTEERTKLENANAPQQHKKTPDLQPSSLFSQIRSKISETHKQENIIIKSDDERSRPVLSQGQIFTEQQRLRQDTLKQQEQEDDSIRKLKQIEEKKKKEKALMDALVSQRVKEEIERRQNEEKLRQEEERERFLKSRQEATKFKSKHENVMSKKKVNIEQEQERTRLDKNERVSKIHASGLNEVVRKANEAVDKRINAGTDKSSPATWAAVKALKTFIESRENNDLDLPVNIERAIKQLSDFLLSDDSSKPGVEKYEIENAEKVESFMKLEVSQSPLDFDAQRLTTRTPSLPRTTTKYAFFRKTKEPRTISITQKPAKQQIVENQPIEIQIPNIPSTIIHKPADNHQANVADPQLTFPLLAQFTRELEEKEVTLDFLNDQRLSRQPPQQERNTQIAKKPTDSVNQFGEPLAVTRQIPTFQDKHPRPTASQINDNSSHSFFFKTLPT